MLKHGQDDGSGLQTVTARMPRARLDRVVACLVTWPRRMHCMTFGILSLSGENGHCAKRRFMHERARNYDYTMKAHAPITDEIPNP